MGVISTLKYFLFYFREDFILKYPKEKILINQSNILNFIFLG